MTAILPHLGNVQVPSWFARLRGTAGLCMGPTSTANKWSATAGDVYNWQNNRYFGARWWRVGRSVNNQTVWACNSTTTKGWRWILGNDTSDNLFFGASLRNFRTSYLGLNDVLIGKDNSGNFVQSVNGDTGAVFISPGAYTAADGTSVQAFGVDASNNNFAATQAVFLQHYVVDFNLSPSQMGSITGSVNALDCWNLSRYLVNTSIPGFIVAPTAVYDWQLWNGSASTFTGSGSGAFTFTKGGTGGGQHTFPGWDRARIPSKAYFFNGRNNYYENGAWNHSLFSAATIVTDAVDTTNGPGGLGLECYGKDLNVVANNVAGFNVSGTNIALGNNIMAEADVFGVPRAISLPGVVAGSGKTVIFTGPLLSEVAATREIKPACEPQAIRIATGASLVFGNAFASPPADLQLIIGDSLIQEVVGLSDSFGVKGPPVDAVVTQLRAGGGREVRGEGHGFGTYFERINTAADLAEFVDIIVRQCVGTSTNWVRCMLEQNDMFLNTYLLQTTFRANLDAFIAAWLVRRPTGGKLQLIGTTSYTGGTTPNPSGWVLANFTTTVQAAVTAAASAFVSFVDAVNAVSNVNKGDGKHFTRTGATELVTFYNANTP